MSGRSDLRLAERLAAPGVRIVTEGKAAWLVGGGRRTALSADIVRSMLARGAIEPGEGGYRLSEAGRGMMRRLAAGNDFVAQHQSRDTVAVETETGRRTVTVDQAESPLAWLRTRKDKDGRPMLDAIAYEAGERLRADFTRGQLMPRVTANWGAAVASGRRGGGVAELTEAALSARLRVDRALAAIGPELAGIAVDFCCFLKGLETIETERRWPRRSAKLVLQLALSALARHYGLDRTASGPETGVIRHWGDIDFRPSIE